MPEKKIASKSEMLADYDKNPSKYKAKPAKPSPITKEVLAEVDAGQREAKRRMWHSNG